MAGFNVADYVDVQERINRFWKEYPDGAIASAFKSLDAEGKRVVVTTNVWKKRPETMSAIPDVTGIAMEVEGSSNVNKTSHIENCETSAIGRALANMGYAKTGKDRPSKQEMEKVARAEQAHGPKAGTKPANDPQELVIPNGKYKGVKVGALNGEECDDLLAIPAIAASEYGQAIAARLATLNTLAKVPELQAVNGVLDLESGK